MDRTLCRFMVNFGVFKGLAFCHKMRGPDDTAGPRWGYAFSDEAIKLLSVLLFSSPAAVTHIQAAHQMATNVTSEIDA